MILLLLTLLDGSLIHLRVDNFPIQLEGRYGVLSIPVKDLIDCSAGVHYADENEYKHAYESLGSQLHGSRDRAMKFLATHQRGAYKYVMLGLKTEDLEVVKRCEELLASYNGRFPAIDDELRVSGYGTVSGTIKNKYIEGVSVSLGAMKIDMSQVDFIIKKSEEKIKLTSAIEWKACGFVKGSLSIDITGKVDIWPQTPGQYVTDGNGLINNQAMANGYNVGAVVGKVGEKTFLVGSHFKTENIDAGMLMLRINPAQWSGVNATEGFLEVSIK